MASAFTHVFAAASLGAVITPGRVVPRLLILGAACSVLPDLDVVGFRLGVSYGDLLGHRGLSHSLLFAFLTALIATKIFFSNSRFEGLRVRVVIYLFVVTASHGFFDAMTNGGLGVAFFSPFDPTRYFLPLQPVEVSPIGFRAFFTARSLGVLASELIWIVLPWAVIVLVVKGLVGRSGAGSSGGSGSVRAGF
jgi:inner membrane protein